MRRRIALISEHASPLGVLGGVDSGGQNVYVAQVAKHLAAAGHDVDVFTRRDDERLPEIIACIDGSRLIHVPAGPPAYVRKEELLPFMDAFTAYVRRFCACQRVGYDLVHANFWMSGLVACELKQALGTPFVMQVGDKKFNMKTDGFLPRNKAIECYHRQGNKLFGIKFKISPIIYKTRVNFAEYREYIYPLSYLMDQPVIDQVKKAASFEERIETLNTYFQSIIKRYSGSWEAIRIVSEILQHCDSNNDFTTSVEDFAAKYNISARTLHRYFENSTSLSSKKALQILRIRKAVKHLANSPAGFNYEIYGYYDYSHFCKHLKKFLQKDTINSLKPHLQLLQSRKMK